MRPTSRDYTSDSTASARERELCAERRWEEAGRFVTEVMRRVPEWLRPRLDRGPRFQRPRVDEYDYARSMNYPGAAPMGARERDLREERRWEDAGRVVADLARVVPQWFRLPPEVERHFETACIEQLRGVRAMIDHEITKAERRRLRRTGTKIPVE